MRSSEPILAPITSRTNSRVTPGSSVLSRRPLNNLTLRNEPLSKESLVTDYPLPLDRSDGLGLGVLTKSRHATFTTNTALFKTTEG